MATATQRVRMIADGRVFSTFTEVEVTRDMSDLAGSFSLQCLEPLRTRAFLGKSSQAEPLSGIKAGGRVSIFLDGELVLLGWVDQVRLATNGTDLVCTVQGRDVAGDLVDCAAAPDGPGEMRDLSLTQIVERLARPFGLRVRADVDVGKPFPRFGVDPDELAFDAIAKACRQRAILCVSDGIGGLVLTRGGRNRGPAAIRLGEAPIESEVTHDWSQRFSEIVVKGQVEKAGGNRRPTAALNADADPILPSVGLPRPAPTVPAAGQGEARGVLMTGRARDTAITRYRPRVVLAQTQSGGNSVQTQAEWSVRVQRSQALTAYYTLTDWRPAAGKPLWRPNQIVEVADPYAQIAEDMLIAGATYFYSAEGTRTRLRLVGREAFDLLPEGEARQAQRAAKVNRPLNTEARSVP